MDRSRLESTESSIWGIDLTSVCVQKEKEKYIFMYVYICVCVCWCGCVNEGKKERKIDRKIERRKKMNERSQNTDAFL